MKRSKFFLLILILALSLLTHTAYSADQSLAFKVTDISDRKYEPAVIELLDNAKSSIVISMYSISLGKDTNNPVRLLLNDLLEASDRGVKVTLYINTRFRRNAKKPFIKSPIFKKLEDAGCVIYPLPSKRKLHDKLIIVDERYVVEGSTNWSISALKNNFESATLIDSSDLAKVKLARVKNFLTASKRQSERSYTPVYLENLPKVLIIPKELLLNKEYFPKMVSKNDKRSLNLYLLFLAYSQITVKEDFFISLEAMALSLEMPDTWTYSTLRRQMIKCLKKLQYRYNLIEVKFFHGKDASIKLCNLKQTPFAILPKASVVLSAQGEETDTFNILTNSIVKTKGPELTVRLKFLLLIKALIESEGEDLESISKNTLAKRFFINRSTITAAFNDLRECGSK